MREICGTNRRSNLKGSGFFFGRRLAGMEKRLPKKTPDPDGLDAPSGEGTASFWKSTGRTARMQSLKPNRDLLERRSR
jgi:hypothetical protein